MAFDPDAFLAKKSTFDPDAYLSKSGGNNPPLPKEPGVFKKAVGATLDVLGLPERKIDKPFREMAGIQKVADAVGERTDEEAFPASYIPGPGDPPIGGAAPAAISKTAIEMAGSPTSYIGSLMKVPGIISKAVGLTGKAAQISKPALSANKAASKVGYTLTKGMEEAPIGKTVGGGKWQELESGLLQNMPFSRKLFGAMKEKNYAVAKNELDRIQSSVVDVGDEALKARLQGEVDKANGVISGLYTNVGEEAKKMYVQTEGLSQSIKKTLPQLYDKDGQLKSTLLPFSKSEAKKLDGYIRDFDNLGVRTGRSGSDNWTLFTELRKRIGGETGRAELMKTSAMAQSMPGAMNSTDAGNLSKAYSRIYGKLMEVERSHVAEVEKVTGQVGLLKTYDDARELFRMDRPIQQTINRIVGTGNVFTDKNFKSASKAVNSLLNPKEKERFGLIWDYVDEDTQAAIRGNLLSNIIKPARTVRDIEGQAATVDISINRLGKEWNKYRQSYGDETMKKVFGKTFDDMNQYIVGSERARVDRVGLYNEANPSGTGAATTATEMLKGLLNGGVGSAAIAGTGIVGAKVLSPFMLAIAPAMLYGTRVASKIATKTPLSKFDKGVIATGKGIGATAKYGFPAGSTVEKTRQNVFSRKREE